MPEAAFRAFVTGVFVAVVHHFQGFRFKGQLEQQTDTVNTPGVHVRSLTAGPG
jgi:hypothetical protein